MLTLIAARFVFPVSSTPIVDGAVVVEGERIVAVGSAAELREWYQAARQMELGEALLLPAAVNAHTHLELTALEDTIPEGLDMASWILALLRARNAMDDAELRASAEEGVRRSVASGVAAVGEICSAGQSVGPVVESGLRGIVYYELLNGDPAQAEATLARGKATIARWRAEYSGARVRFGLSLHAPYTVSRPLFERTAAWCRDEGLPLSVHAAESPAETRWLLDRSGPIRDTLYATLGRPADLETAPGVSPMRYLHECGALGPETLLAHGVWADQNDLALVVESGAVVAHCPRSNARLLNGRLPWAAYRAAGARLALGTDSLASSPSLSIWEEAAYAHTLHRTAGEPPTPEDMLRLATLGGADALGIADELGSLEPGKAAALAWAPLAGASLAERAEPERALAALMERRITPRALAVGA
ncbi:MAG TPA: amidohydrolase family protein [Ktedonobacterales bacterium]|nr:amidohydrolase family protein [Ktedonobacterales bacterium]